MSLDPYESEVEAYLCESADLSLPEGDHLAAFIEFACNILQLVRSCWPSESSVWWAALESRKHGALTLTQWRSVQSNISAYRASIGEAYGMNEPHGANAAISFLFALAIESPQVPLEEYRSPQFGRLLDEFSCEFIEHFGHSRELLAMLRKAFHFGGA